MQPRLRHPGESVNKISVNQQVAPLHRLHSVKWLIDLQQSHPAKPQELQRHWLKDYV